MVRKTGGISLFFVGSLAFPGNYVAPAQMALRIAVEKQDRFAGSFIHIPKFRAIDGDGGLSEEELGALWMSKSCSTS